MRVVADEATKDWSSELYLKFEAERTRAARDLLARVELSAPGRIVDLGCGPGNSTELIVEAWPDARVTGVDFSPGMIEAARRRAPGATFLETKIETWRSDAPLDLIFSNAALHFVADHREILVRLTGQLAPGGVLAVQMPDATHEICHAAMRMAAVDGPWADRLAPIAKTQAVLASPEEYYRMLRPLCSSIDIWETTYVHPLAGPEGVVEWFEGSGLRPFLAPLTQAERVAFLGRYRRELSAYPLQPDGKLLLFYPRLFFVLVR